MVRYDQVFLCVCMRMMIWCVSVYVCMCVVCEKCQGATGKWHVHDFLPDLDASAGYDKASRAYTSLPVLFQMTVKPSSIPGAGLGVFANTFISSNVRVGLFEGKIVTGEEMKACDTAYAWEVSGQRGRVAPLSCLYPV